MQQLACLYLICILLVTSSVTVMTAASVAARRASLPQSECSSSLPAACGIQLLSCSHIVSLCAATHNESRLLNARDADGNLIPPPGQMCVHRSIPGTAPQRPPACELCLLHSQTLMVSRQCYANVVSLVTEHRDSAALGTVVGRAAKEDTRSKALLLTHSHGLEFE